MVLLLLLMIFPLYRGIHFAVLDLLPDEAGVSVKLEAEDEGVGEGAGDGDVGSIPCEVWVNCGGESEALHVDTGLVVHKELTGKLYSGELELDGRCCGSPWSLGEGKLL